MQYQFIKCLVFTSASIQPFIHSPQHINFAFVFECIRAFHSFPKCHSIFLWGKKRNWWRSCWSVCVYTTSTWHLQNCWVSNWSDKQNDETLLLCVMARLLNLSVGCGLRFDQWLDFYFYNSDNAIESFSSSDSGFFCIHSLFTWETVIKNITHIHKQMIKCHHQFFLIYLKCTACNKALPLPCSVCVSCNIYAVCNVR